MRIEEISIDSKKYPQKLRNIYDPPKKLYVYKTIILLKLIISIFLQEFL